jgi:hypothetical protein
MEKCMSAQSESKGPVILFCILWWVLAHEPDYESHAFLYALALMLIGWLAIRLAGNGYSRLGKRAVFLMLQVAGWFFLFLSFAPGRPNLKLLAIWGFGIPLVFAGAAARLTHDRFPKIQKRPDEVLGVLFGTALTFGTLGQWEAGYGFWASLWRTIVVIIFSLIPLYYGWRLGEPVPRGERDARFGSQDDYRAAGMSDER